VFIGILGDVWLYLIQTPRPYEGGVPLASAVVAEARETRKLLQQELVGLASHVTAAVHVKRVQGLAKPALCKRVQRRVSNTQEAKDREELEPTAVRSDYGNCGVIHRHTPRKVPRTHVWTAVRNSGTCLKKTK